jgi:hypothetical protein
VRRLKYPGLPGRGLPEIRVSSRRLLRYNEARRKMKRWAVSVRAGRIQRRRDGSRALPAVKESDNITILLSKPRITRWESGVARPLRIEDPGAVCPVMARANPGPKPGADNADCWRWSATSDEACKLTGWRLHAWVRLHLAEPLSFFLRGGAGRVWCETRRVR